MSKCGLFNNLPLHAYGSRGLLSLSFSGSPRTLIAYPCLHIFMSLQDQSGCLCKSVSPPTELIGFIQQVVDSGHIPFVWVSWLHSLE